MSWNQPNQQQNEDYNDDYYDSEEEEIPLQMSSWGTGTVNQDGSTTVDVSAEGWASLIDPSVKLKSNGVGSGQLHRRGNNYKPVDEAYIVNRRLNLPVKGSGKKSRSGSSTPKSAPSKKAPKKSGPPPPRQERLVPPSSSLNRGRPPINPNTSAWGSANLASTPFWEQQNSATGSSASKYATHNSAPTQAPPPAQQPQWGQSQQPQQQQAQSQWGQPQPQYQQQQQPPQQPVQSQWGQPQQQQQQPPQQPVQSQWGQPQQQQQPVQSQWAQQQQQPPQQPPQQQPVQSQWGQQQQYPPQQQQQQQQPPQQPVQSQWGQPQQQAPIANDSSRSKYAHGGSNASMYAPQGAPPPQQAPAPAQPTVGAPCIKFNITLGVGITAELSVYQNDDPEDVVNNFEKKHHLSMSDVAKANFAVKIRELLKQYTGHQ